MLFPRLLSLVPSSIERRSTPADIELGGLLQAHYRGTDAYASFQQFLAELGGTCFFQGGYAVFDAGMILQLTPTVLGVGIFQNFSGHVLPLGRDWQGRVFVADFSRATAAWPAVGCFDVDTHEAMNTGLDLLTFHEQTVVNDAPDVFSLNLYGEWQTHAAPVQSMARAVGYRIPLALGGEDTFDNREEVDLSVYWHLTGDSGVPDTSSPSQ